MTTTAAPTPRFDTFYKHDELTQLLFDYAQAFPTLVAVRSIGKSYEGRDIWVATVTNIATGAAADKPAFWTDGNIHAAELTASTAVLYYLNGCSTQYGSDADRSPQLLDTRAVYLCPRLNPDGAELALADRPRHIRSSTRRYPFDEEPVEGLTRRGHRWRRPHPLHAHRRSARHVQEVRGRSAPDGGARAGRVRRRVLPADARGLAARTTTA